MDFIQKTGYYYKMSTLLQILNRYKKWIRPNDCCIDIGAGIGEHSQKMLEFSRPNGKIYAFEAHPFNFQKLKQKEIDNLFCIHTAIGNIKGNIKLFYNADNQKYNYGDSTIMPHLSTVSRLTNNIRSIVVPIITLDDVCNEYDIQPNFIKIDVEGAEAEVIKGGINTIIKYRPTILFEHGYSNKYDEPQTPYLLTSLNYHIYTENYRKLNNNEYPSGLDLLAIYK